MSRAINLKLTPEEVLSAVSKHGAIISAIEPLFPEGTRVVLTSSDRAAAIRRALKLAVISGPVERTPRRAVRI